MTWQGQHGPIPGATTILAGMKQDAPKAKITYSEDASAPMSGYSIGVVVVGESPYAEGMGDVGVNGHTLQLTVADRDAVNKVCSAMKCVVLDVSGRPLDITGVVPQADAVVASWLPGSEGEGVADVLFGLKPFTGRLPVSWAKAESQLPINVGDATYQPLYPYGWGLRTDTAAARLKTLAANLYPGTARWYVLHALTARTSAQRLADVQGAANAMTKATWWKQNAIVSVARDIAQARIVADNAMDQTATSTSNAERALLTERPGYAVTLLTRAYNASLKHAAYVRALAAKRK